MSLATQFDITCFGLMRQARFELTPQVWKTRVLPLNTTDALKSRHLSYALEVLPDVFRHHILLDAPYESTLRRRENLKMVALFGFEPKSSGPKPNIIVQTRPQGSNHYIDFSISTNFPKGCRIGLLIEHMSKRILRTNHRKPI